MAAAGAFAAAGILLLMWQLLFPTHAERVIGEAKVTIQHAIHDVTTASSAEDLVVYLGPLGGMRELDWCDGRFIELDSYRITGVLPVYAAHNNCGGDIILSLELGDRVKVGNDGTVYQVVEERHTTKYGNVGSLRGMTGELLLQTCFYGQNKMRFLALAVAND